MTQDEMNAYLAALSDEELQEKRDIAAFDLETASLTQPGSDWHDCCFAGFVALCFESNRRATEKLVGSVQ